MPDADTRAKALCTGSVYAIRTVLNLDATSRRARYDVRGDSTAIVQAYCPAQAGRLSEILAGE